MGRAAKSLDVRAIFATALAVVLGGIVGCSSGSTAAPAGPPVSVTVTGAGQVRLNSGAQLAASVSNASNSAVTWQVNGVAGGTAVAGTISAAGFYTAPATLPSPNMVTITAVSQADQTASGSATETVLNLVPVVTSGTAAQTGSGGVVSLDVLGANFASGIQLLVGGVGATTQFVSSNEATAAVIPAAGVTSLTITVVNADSGSVVSNAVTVQVPQISVTVSGATQTHVGGTSQFTATVANSPNTAVTWQVNGVTGGSGATGTISATGLYTAPVALPSTNPVTITAISQAAPNPSGSATVTILNLIPVLSSGTAAQTGTGGVVSLDMLGTGFVSGIQLQVSGVGVTTQFVSVTEAQATWTPAAGVTSVSVAAVNPNSGGAISNAVTVQIPQISVTVSGAAQTRVGASTQFTATVTNSPNTAVTWQVNGVTGGSATTGTISATGLYTAPAALPSANPVTITAISQALASATGTLQESIWNAIPVVVSGTATPTGSAGALLLDVKGTSFVTGAQIQAGGVLQTTQFISSTEVQAAFNPAAGATSVVVAVVNPNPGSVASNTLSIGFPAITVSVTGAAQTRVGQTTQFTATVTGTSNTAVLWQVNGVTGGSATTGTISLTGLYAAPATLPTPNVVTVSAVSQESAAAMGSLQETVLNLVPTLTAVVPTLTNTAGTVLLDVTGTNFAGGSQIQVGGMNLNTTLISATEMQANYQPGTSATSITGAASTPNDGSALSNVLTVTLPTIYAYTGALPVDEIPSPYFAVSAGGVPVHTYQAQARSVNFSEFKSAFTGQYYYPDAPYQGTYAIMSFASVQLNGRSQVAISFPAGYPTTGAITSSSKVKILPTGAIDPTTITVSNNTVQFAVSESGVAQQLTIEVDGDYLNSLHLFVNPFDVVPTGGTNIPPGYITQANIQSYTSPFKFGPGEYWINGDLDFRVDSDIYLADGAILKWVTPFYPALNTGPMITLGGNPGAPHVNMFLHGSGIIDGQAAQQYAANNGNGCGYGAELVNANNLTLTATNKAGIDGVILRNSCVFNMPVGGVIGYPTNHFVINNVKILGFEGNTDGIDLFTDQYIDVTHSFFRTADDEVVVYQVNTPSAYPTTNITVTNNVMWNELAHALTVGAAYNATGYTYGVSDVVFDHNTIIHDTGKAFLIGHFNGFPGTVKNITFSNITIEESRSAIGIVQNPTYGDTDNPGIVGPITFSNINITAPQQVQTVNTYVTPVPNIQFLIQLPYGNPYVGNGTTTGAMPTSIQGPIVFNNVVANGKPVTSYYLSPGYYDTSNNPVAENVIAEGVTLRNATYGTFIFEPSQVAGDIFIPQCNGAPCPLIP